MVAFRFGSPARFAAPCRSKGTANIHYFLFEGDTHEKESPQCRSCRLSACGASKKNQNISDVASAASSEATSTTASSESTGDAAQELTFVLSNIPDGLDPSVTNNSFAQYVLINCFEGLVTYDSTHPGSRQR